MTLTPKSPESPESPEGRLYESRWPHRTFAYSPHLGSIYGRGKATPTVEEKANLILSSTREGMHAPALDIDFPAQLIPSRTPGHFHLYLDTEISWKKYKKLLIALGEAGILEPGYVSASLAEQCSALRWEFRKWLVPKEVRVEMIEDLKSIVDG